MRNMLAMAMLTASTASAPAQAPEQKSDVPAQSAPEATPAPKESAPAPQAQPEPTWDRVASIKGAAERLGFLHRARGAKAAYDLIDNCYRTHSLAENYGEGFETCIAQDYLETTVLAKVYARLPPEQLQKMGMPSPAMLADAMGRRVTAAFNQYRMPAAYAVELKGLVDTHGLPIFLAIVFPEAAQPQPGGAEPKKQ
jgi:hypothetical protein